MDVNRAARRKHSRALSRAARKGHAEEGSGTVGAICGHRTCGRPIIVGAPDIQSASAAVQRHYNEAHGGRQPDE